MNTLHKSLSFAQMLVRAQWRHEGRTPGPAAVPPPGVPERRARPRPAAWPLAATPVPRG